MSPYVNLLRLWRSPLRKDRPIALVLLWLDFLWYCGRALEGLFRQALPAIGDMLDLCAFVVACLVAYVVGRALWRVHFWPHILGCLFSFFLCGIFLLGILSPKDLMTNFDTAILELAASIIALAACVRLRSRINHYDDPHAAWGLPAWMQASPQQPDS